MFWFGATISPLSALAYPTGSAAMHQLRARKPPPFRPGPSALDAQLGRRQGEGRPLVGATQKERGAALGVSAAMVRRDEDGLRALSPTRFAAAIAFLGLPWSWFLAGDPER